MSDRWLSRAVIGVPFHWALVTNEAAFHEELAGLKVPRPWPEWVVEGKSATVHELKAAGDDGLDCWIVCIRDADKHTPIEVAGLLVHEAVHLWQAVREWMREDTPSAEFEAYSIQRLALSLMDAYAQTLT